MPACALLIALAAYLCWSSAPQVILVVAPLLEKKGEAGGQWLRDKLIACGPRAIQPTIQAIAQYSAWVRNYAYLPQVLEHFGDPARTELIAAIDKETDSKRRAYLISALQSGFTDFSRLEIVLNDHELSRSSLTHMAVEVRRAFPTAPDLAGTAGINSEFVTWWSTSKSSRE